MEMLDRHMYRILSTAVVVLLGTGVIFYHTVEKFSWVNSWYFCVATLATVGYGDIVPKTDIGKLFTTGYIIIGVGILTTFITTTVKRRGVIARKKFEQSLKTGIDKNERPS